MITITTGLDYTLEKREWLIENVGAFKPGGDSLFVHEGDGWSTRIQWGGITTSSSHMVVMFEDERMATLFILRWG